jgi:hypothetical protein
MNPNMFSPEWYFGDLTKKAKKLVQYEKSGKPIPKDIDFAVAPTCLYCQKTLMVEKPNRCSACKAVLYCGKEVILSTSSFITIQILEICSAVKLGGTTLDNSVYLTSNYAQIML